MISLMLNEPFHNYELFVDGRIYNNLTKKWIKPSKNSSGYLRYCLQHNKIKKRFFLHRLLAEYFIGKSCDTKDVVDHIDCNKLNNDIGNLRWVTKRENGFNRKCPKKDKIIPYLNIYKKPSGNYEIQIKRYGRNYIKTMTTLDDAIKQRDLMKSMWSI